VDHIIREATETELYPSNKNRETDFCLSKSWELIIGPLKQNAESFNHTINRDRILLQLTEFLNTALRGAQTLSFSGHTSVRAFLLFL
jgi:hypothetical protein